jgi:hypothetical protein
MKRILVLLTLAACSSFASYAQLTSTANQNVVLNLSNVVAITFVSSGTAVGNTVTIPFATVSDYTNGVISSAQQLKVQSNKNFNLTINAGSTNFSYTGLSTPAPVMPINGVLYAQVSNNSTGGSIASAYNNTYGNISTTAQSIIANCLNGGNQLFSIQYEAIPGFNYPAGTYTANIYFTASQP